MSSKYGKKTASHYEFKKIILKHKIGKFGGMNSYAFEALFGLPSPWPKNSIQLYENASNMAWTKEHERIETEKLAKLGRKPTLEDYMQAHTETLVEMGDAKTFEEGMKDAKRMIKWAKETKAIQDAHNFSTRHQ